MKHSSGKEILIFDGGLGTSLEDKYHVRFSESTPLWSSHLLVSDSQTLAACQADFAPHVDVLQTPTYQVSIEGFKATKTEQWPNGIDQAAIVPFLEDALHVAERARGDGHAQLSLSVGPYGACMVPSQEYSGRYDAAHDSLEALYEWHYARFRLFASTRSLFNRIGYVAFETIPRVDEIVAVRKLVKELVGSGKGSSPSSLQQVPHWISCLFPGEENMLPDGSSVQQVIEAMLSSEISGIVPWGVGINCTKIAKLPSLVAEYEAAVDNLINSGRLAKWPSLVLYPDGTNGEVYNTTTRRWELPHGQAGPKVREVNLLPSFYDVYFSPLFYLIVTLLNSCGIFRCRGKRNLQMLLKMRQNRGSGGPSSSEAAVKHRMQISTSLGVQSKAAYSSRPL